MYVNYHGIEQPTSFFKNQGIFESNAIEVGVEVTDRQSYFPNYNISIGLSLLIMLLIVCMVMD